MANLTQREQSYLETIQQQLEAGVEIYLSAAHPSFRGSEGANPTEVSISPALQHELLKLGVKDARVQAPIQSPAQAFDTRSLQPANDLG